MEPNGWHITLVLLALLAYALITCTLSSLAARIRQQRVRHDLILASRRRRQEYLDAVQARHDVEVG